MNKTHLIPTTGRRKTAVARVLLKPLNNDGSSVVNRQKIDLYFTPDQIHTIMAPIAKLELLDKFVISANVNGGGKSAQATAIQMGIARQIIKLEDAELYKNQLKKYGYLTRDPRARERNKPGHTGPRSKQAFNRR